MEALDMQNHHIRPALPTLTAVRFFAAFIVFLFHGITRFPCIKVTFLANIVQQGAVGMSLFFVLSGFVLTYNYYNVHKPIVKDYSGFIVKRLARIYPVYVVAGIVVLFFVPLATGPEKIQKTLFLIGTNIFAIQAWFPTTFGYWNDNGTWSLSVEAFCYLMFPMILYFFSQKNIKNLVIIVLVCYILTLLPAMSASLYKNQSPFPLIYVLPIYRIPEFAVGMIACLFFLKMNEAPKYIQCQIFLTLMVGALWLGIFGPKFSYYVGHNFIIIPVCAYFIYLSANLKKGWMFQLFNNPFLQFFGEASYSFYMFQFIPLLYTMNHYPRILSLFPIFQQHHFLSGNGLLVFILFLITLGISCLSYVYIEKPMRKRIINYYYARKERSVIPTGGNVVTE